MQVLEVINISISGFFKKLIVPRTKIEGREERKGEGDIKLSHLSVTNTHTDRHTFEIYTQMSGSYVDLLQCKHL